MDSGFPKQWELHGLFQDELMEGESIQWIGQPDPSVIFSKGDIFFVPFSLLWGGFALFWEWSALTSPLARSSNPWGFGLFGIPFVLMGLYLIFGRFIYKAWKKRRTCYAITDKRVLVLTLGWRRSIQGQFISAIPVINKYGGSRGTGTLLFGNVSLMSAMYGNSGLEFFQGYGSSAIAFYDIKDPGQVYQLIVRLRQQ